MTKRFIGLLLAAVVLFTAVFIPNFNAEASGVTQKITPVSGGLSHSIALKDDGTIWTWGSNRQLQLGYGSIVTELLIPEQVEDLTSIISVAAGYEFSLALRFDGSVYVLGPGGSSSTYRVPGLAAIVAVAAGQTDGLAMDIDGTVWQWTIGGSPRKILENKGVAAITAGGAHFFALTYSGDVWAWGNNMSGQLGNGTTISSEVPIKIETLANIVSITAGFSHTLAVSHNGSLYAWGSNTFGQLGDGTTETRLSPIKIDNISNALQVSAGHDSSMALTKDHNLYTWGYGEFGQLGDGTTDISKDIPEIIETESTPIFIASGVNHNFYVSDEGNLYAWGRNRNGQLGTGRSTNEIQPFEVLDGLANVPEEGFSPRDPFAGASTWAIPELRMLHTMDLLPPMLWGNYRTNTTRAEFAGLLVYLYEAIKEDEISYPTRTDFTDIENHAYEIEIRKAFEIRLVSGVSETRFNPQGEITRQEAAKMICTFIAIMEDKLEPQGFHSVAYYRDAHTIADWAVASVAYAYENDIMQGSEGYFNPLRNITREQTLLIIYRTIIKYGWVL